MKALHVGVLCDMRVWVCCTSPSATWPSFSAPDPIYACTAATCFQYPQKVSILLLQTIVSLRSVWVARSMKALYARVAGPCNAWSLIIGRSVYLAWVGDDMIIIIFADLIHEGWWYIINHCLSFIYPILTFAANRNTWFLDPPLFKTPILVREGESLYSCMTFANLILNGQKRVKSWPRSMNASLYAWASRTSEHLLLV